MAVFLCLNIGYIYHPKGWFFCAKKVIEKKEARRILGAKGKEMTDEKIEQSQAGLYALIGQLLDNHMEHRAICKKQQKQ